jgi:LDH2 family malate/lactate/ureidoglycolate dehydrogenase
MNRLWVYVEDVANGVKGEGGNVATSPLALFPAGVPTVLKQKGATAWVDGQQLLGVVVGNFCTDLAIGLAKEHGIGWVVANNSNHYGICQHYAKRMARAGMIVGWAKPAQ